MRRTHGTCWDLAENAVERAPTIGRRFSSTLDGDRIGADDWDVRDNEAGL